MQERCLWVDTKLYRFFIKNHQPIILKKEKEQPKLQVGISLILNQLITVNKKKIWNTGGATNLDELRERTKNIVLRRLKTDILDLPDKIITPVFLDLKSTYYDEELEDFMRITSESKSKESLSVTINRLMKVRQVIAHEKVDYTCELIDKCIEQGKKVIVFTNFTMTLDMIHEKYKKNSVVLDGRMSKEKRQQSVDRFQNEDKIKIFIKLKFYLWNQ